MCTIMKNNEKCDPSGLSGATIGEVCMSYTKIHCLGHMKKKALSAFVLMYDFE
jgi:hypothetical protein